MQNSITQLIDLIADELTRIKRKSSSVREALARLARLRRADFLGEKGMDGAVGKVNLLYTDDLTTKKVELIGSHVHVYGAPIMDLGDSVDVQMPTGDFNFIMGDGDRNVSTNGDSNDGCAGARTVSSKSFRHSVADDFEISGGGDVEISNGGDQILSCGGEILLSAANGIKVGGAYLIPTIALSYLVGQASMQGYGGSTKVDNGVSLPSGGSIFTDIIGPSLPALRAGMKWTVSVAISLFLKTKHGTDTSVNSFNANIYYQSPDGTTLPPGTPDVLCSNNFFLSTNPNGRVATAVFTLTYADIIAFGDHKYDTFQIGLSAVSIQDDFLVNNIAITFVSGTI